MPIDIVPIAEEHIAGFHAVGFTVEGRRRQAFHVDGAFYDVILMGLLFDAEPAVSDLANENQPAERS